MITTINHRHRFDLPKGYSCGMPRHLMEQVADKCVSECGGRSTLLQFDKGCWSVFITTDPVDSNALAIIDRKLTDLFEAHRKTS